MSDPAGPDSVSPPRGSVQCPSIQLVSTQTLIRYISEWDPRELAHTKGGYLEGVITLPDINGKLRMEICTYPALDADPLISSVHPILLHLVRIGASRREQELEPVPTYTHWRQVFEIEDNQVYVLNQRSELDIEKDGRLRAVPERDLVGTVQGGTITLSKKKGDLNLILLQPKQRSRAQCSEATVTKVLMDRLNITKESLTHPYEKLFKGKNTKNMKRLRIKVDFIAEDFHISVVSAQTIIDTSNKDIGAMDFVEAGPSRSCTRGGRRIVMISEYSLCKDIQPVFLVYTVNPETGQEEERPDLQQFLVDPKDIEVRNTCVVFYSPAQPLVSSLPPNTSVKLAVRRKGDGHISCSKFDWEFMQHGEDGMCLECDWEVDLV